VGLLYNERGDVSILANEKISIAKDSYDSIALMSRSQLPEFLQARIGGKGKMTATEVAERGGLAVGYLNDLKNDKKDGLSCSADIILRLAKGLNEPPAVVFQAAIGQYKSGLKDESVIQVLEEFASLDPRSRNDLEFIFEQFKRMVRERTLNAESLHI
jgi:transcriptional regulator with XRE-family HTH domain